MPNDPPTPVPETVVVVAGATGDLGGRIVGELLAHGVTVRALLRPDAASERVRRMTARGVTPVTADPGDVTALAVGLQGATCVVSALSGLDEVILERQSTLIDATARASVPRFLSSDFSADFTRTRPGHNRNFDLRREFAGRADRAPVAVTSILCGAFLDMLGAEMPIIVPRLRAVLYWGEADQPLDFTTRQDTAAYTAETALDQHATPRWLRIAGDTLSTRDIAAVMTELSGKQYRPVWCGTVGVLAALTAAARQLAPQPGVVFPAWQGMAYMRDMFSGQARLHPLDNDRYPNLNWTTVRDRFTHGHLPGTRSPSRSTR